MTGAKQGLTGKISEKAKKVTAVYWLAQLPEGNGFLWKIHYRFYRENPFLWKTGQRTIESQNY